MSNLPKILIALLSTHERNGWMHRKIVEWQEYLRLQGDQLPYAIRLMVLHNFIPAASARNHACEFFLHKTDADWLLFVDNDMAVPDNLLDTIKDAPKDAAAVCPVFHLWAEDTASVTVCWGVPEETITEDTRKRLLRPDGFKEITKCGTGALFIHRRALEHIQPPYFWYTYNHLQGQESTEDINFCRKVVQAGLKIYGNPKIQVGHYHNVNLAVMAKLVYGLLDENERLKKELDSKDILVVDKAECPSDSPVAMACPA